MTHSALSIRRVLRLERFKRRNLRRLKHLLPVVRAAPRCVRSTGFEVHAFLATAASRERGSFPATYEPRDDERDVAQAQDTDNGNEGDVECAEFGARGRVVVIFQ